MPCRHDRDENQHIHRYYIAENQRIHRCAVAPVREHLRSTANFDACPESACINC